MFTLSHDVSAQGDTRRRSLTRRHWMTVGGISALGLSTATLDAATLRAAVTAGQPSSFGRAKRCLIVLLKGGPSQLDTFDMKPQAPREIRGEFRPIATKVPGMFLCEHLPRLAMQMDKVTIVRTMHMAGSPAHSTAAYEATTGFPFPRGGEAVSTRNDHPHMGSVVAALSPSELPVPPFMMIPNYLVVNGEHRGGQHAGLLGPRFDPFIPPIDPLATTSPTHDFAAAPGVSIARLSDRQQLLHQLDTSHALGHGGKERSFGALQAHALEMVRQGRVQDAFALDHEPPRERDRYGRSLLGQSLLFAKRLLLAGVRLLQVNCMSSVLEPDRNWDTHKQNFRTLRETLLPRADFGLSALLEDLDASGILAETLVVVFGEFGRTPRINADAGRDHWPACSSLLIAGAGVPGGATYGRSDEHAAMPIDQPVTPSELIATIYHALGIHPHLTVRTADGRPFPLCTSRPLLDLWSSSG